MSIQTIRLTQTEFKIPNTIHAVQNDTGRQIRMILDDFTVASGDVGELAFRRADDTFFAVSATLETSTNSFLADMTQALTCPGNTYCQLKVTRSSKVVGTFAFDIAVQEDAAGVVSPTSQEGISIVDAIDAAEDAADRAEAAVAIMNGVIAYVDVDEHTLVIETGVTAAEGVGF